MAGINSLLKGAAESFAKDTAGKILTPQQMEFARFLINPQFYLAEQGINKLASVLGYGQEVKQMRSDAQAEKDYYKEIMRDTIGNALPDSIGDVIRANPRVPEADRGPSGTYITYDPETDSWVERQASNPIVPATSSPQFEDLIRNDTYGTLTPGQGQYVGPLPEDNPMFQNRVENLAYDLNSMPTEGVPESLDIERLRNFIYGNPEDYGPTSEMVIVDNKQPNVATETPIDFGGTMDYGNMFDFSGMDFSGMDFGGGGGGGGDRGDFDYSANAMAKGGQILRGKR